MSDLTDHQRKAGSAITERKTTASRRTIAEARKAIPGKRELRARYVAALEGHFAKVQGANLPRTINYAGIHAAATTVEQIRAELGGKR